MENLVTSKNLGSLYKDKKVFITGHTGFKGSWLMALLYTLGANVKGYALEPEYKDGLYYPLMNAKIAESVIADIRDKGKLEKELVDFNPDFIFHLAAQPLVRRSYEIPAETFHVNVVGTANLLEGVKALPGKCSIVIITTDKVYENKEVDQLYNETDRLGGYDPYSASKACTELVTSSFRSSFYNVSNIRSHQKSVATARAGNVIGGGDWSKDRIIPDIVRSLQRKQTVEVRNPHAVRPWQHVLEPLVGYLLLAASLANDPETFSKGYNFGPLPGDHLQVKELVEASIASWGDGRWKDVSNPSEVHEAVMLKLDINLAQQELQWKPRLNARQAIEWTINWYKETTTSKTDITFHQIKQYLSL